MPKTDSEWCLLGDARPIDVLIVLLRVYATATKGQLIS